MRRDGGGGKREVENSQGRERKERKEKNKGDIDSFSLLSLSPSLSFVLSTNTSQTHRAEQAEDGRQLCRGAESRREQAMRRGPAEEGGECDGGGRGGED